MRTKLSVIRIPTVEEFKKLMSLKCKWITNGIEIQNNQNCIRFNANIYNKYYYLTSSYCKDLVYILYPLNMISLSKGLAKYKVRLVSESPLPGFVDLGVGIYWAINDCKGLYKIEETKKLIKLV